MNLAAGSPQGEQQPIPAYEYVRIDTGFKAHLVVVEDKVIVEIKSIELIAPTHKKQLLTYLRLAGQRLGWLINFHVALIKDGITRIVNGLQRFGVCKIGPEWIFSQLLTVAALIGLQAAPLL